MGSSMPLRKLSCQRSSVNSSDAARTGRRDAWIKLVVLGPTFLLKAKHQPKDFDRPITVEMWLYPDGSRILEVSTKCLPKEGFQVAAVFKSYLAGLGIVLGADQAPKTKTALEFFSARLKEEGQAG